MLGFVVTVTESNSCAQQETNKTAKPISAISAVAYVANNAAKPGALEHVTADSKIVPNVSGIELTRTRSRRLCR